MTIRKGTPTDLPEVLELIRELALFERAPEEVTNTLEQLEKDGFGEKPSYQLLVATVDNQVVGMALYFIKYSTWKGKGIYLDDLIVTEKFRGRGIGKRLFDAVVKEAAEINAKQLHWQVLDWNTPAIDFYKKYEAKLEGEWIDCKLDADQIRNFGKG